MGETAIHPDTRIGAVSLKIRDLQRSIEFYTRNLGLSVLSSNRASAQLGVSGACLLILDEDRASHPAPRTAGLYHFAILVTSRLALAKSLKQLIASETPLQGFADHLVSEAVYLADPDGNGIEIYRDRPRDEWPYRNGQLLMATDPLDVNGLLNELDETDDTWTGLPLGTTIGHIHLQVSDLARTIEFYQTILGFDLVLRYGPSAAFLSAGGYHHHIGANTWAGSGIPPAPPEASGLMWFSIDLPDNETYERYVQRLVATSLKLETNDQGVRLRDPSGITIQVQVSESREL